MSKQYIKDLREGDTLCSEFRAVDVVTATAKNGKPFKKGQISDKTGSLFMIGFLPAEEMDLLKTGEVCFVEGKVESYQGKLQAKILSVMPRSSKTDEHFEASSVYSVDDMWGDLVDHISRIENGTIRRVAEDIFLQQGYQDRFKISPAATGMHHAFQGGLLEHTTQMLTCAEALLSFKFFGPLNKDICMFGIMFHDFGKIFEYSTDAGFKKTVQGVLVPHIPMMGALIFETCNKQNVPEIIRDHLMHIVLAHHRVLEWGSPVVPAFPEAAFVHYVDNLHGTVFGWLQKREAKAGQGSEIIDNWDGGKIPLLATPFNRVLEEVEEAANVHGQPFDEGDLPF